MLVEVFPVQWKVSAIVRIHKNLELYDPQNYRSINHKPTLARPVERVVKEQLIRFLTTNGLIGESKHVSLSADPVPLCFFDLVTLNIDKKAVIMVFLNTAKAFVRVPHEVLLQK